MGIISDIGETFMEAAINGIEWVSDTFEDCFNGGRTSLGQTSTASAKKVSKAGAYDPETATIEETKAITKILNEIK
ncbi:hypothetical protein EPJ64_07940 [Brachyspira aalborgi]|jgi:hypothetical protein|nr:hypothetical protein [Brachyspira aalborgi]MBS4764047.1 hypothetical protein [Brachyspira sp.]CCY78720.1 unknown [Brachyspira sp. CAG:700]TXJ15508.1 hypothetical protein EPJ77_10285 [Brachyspira aalborgi]TXJ17855.1 hypothetical protein EPJ64_07940 [Brachyspira aalborgi]TXJ23807.1 hypothetical protein EPJ73_08015 [Brachyspira aalborgi]